MLSTTSRLSAHAGGRYLAITRSSEPARYQTGEPAPVGAVTCEELQEAEGGAPGPTLCMLHEANGPRFGVRLPGQEGWRREGALEECVGCHGTSPRGGWLGP